MLLKSNTTTNLTEGSISKGILSFAIPLFLGQLLQQLYNMADVWVIGNFASNDALAAVSSSGSIIFLIIGLFGGISAGGSVVISRYFGAGDKENVKKAINTNLLMAITACILGTILGYVGAPQIVSAMSTPESVMGDATTYLRIYFAGVSTVIMYNTCMSIMRALGDSIHPLYYLLFSSVVNIFLDLLLIAHPSFKMGVAGAAIATVISQGLSVVLCLLRMCRVKDYTRVNFLSIRYYPRIMKQVLAIGLPSGVQNAVISIGNLVIQKNINSFGSYAMSGHGAYAKIEGFVFLPIMSMSIALPTFISQNLGARQYDRAKKGALFGIIFGVVSAEVTGVIIYIFAEPLLHFFVSAPEAIHYGMIHAHIVTLFYFLLAFSHCTAGVLRGCGLSFVPMLGMLLSWCVIRIVYVTTALQYYPVFQTISWAYPLTWSITTILFMFFLIKSDWVHHYENKK